MVGSPNRNSQSPDLSWHPFKVATAAAFAVSAALIGVFTQVVIPTHTAALNNEIIELRKELKIPEGQKTGVRAMFERITELESELKTTKAKLGAAQLPNLFQSGDPYPVGLSIVKIGGSAETISRHHSKAERKRGYWSVDNPQPLFRSITYIVGHEQSPKVETILLFTEKPLIGEVLQAKLTEALGQPISGPRTGCFKWKVKDGLFVRKDSEISFGIYKSDFGCELD
jgi:hypothetical protein